MLELEALGQTLEGRCRHARCLSPGRGGSTACLRLQGSQASPASWAEAGGGGLKGRSHPQDEGRLVPLSLLSGERLPSLHRCLDGMRARSRQVHRKVFLVVFFF